MRIKITSEQFKLLSSLITEDDAGEIDLNRDVDFSKVSSLEDLKTAVKTIGLQHSEDTKTRSRGLEISKMLSNIESMDDKEVFKKYFTKISELISRYKKGSFSLKKLSEIIYDLSRKDLNVAKQQVEDIIAVFEDPRFGENHKKKLISLLTGSGVIDLDKFYNETRRAYSDYENSFAEGPLSPFTIFRTSPSLKVLLESDLSYNNMEISASEFNSKESDLEKILYIIDKIAGCKFYNPVDDLVNYILNNLKFSILFSYSPANIKADLQLKESLMYENRETKKVTQIAKKGDYVEVKYKPYTTPSYLSEFFKVDATNKSSGMIVEAISRIPKVNDPQKTFKVLMSSLSSNLSRTVKSTDGDKIINHLTQNLSGIIFKDNIFIPKEFIKFFWNDVGYASRSRLSIWYEVDKNPEMYKIANTEKGFSRYVFKP